MHDLQSLSSILSYQADIYTQLLNIEDEKTRILLKGESDELDRLLNEEQPLIMKSSNLEHQRLMLQQKMGIEELTLKQIINDYTDSNKFDLDRHYIELSGLLEKIEKANRLNTRLINSRLKTMRNFFRENDANGIQNTYSKEGLISKR